MHLKILALNTFCLLFTQLTLSSPLQAKESSSHGTITFHGQIVNGTSNTASSQAFTTSAKKANYDILNEVQTQYWNKQQSWDKDQIYSPNDFMNSGKGVIVTKIYN